jgi:tetratricopeptide (TPR) repeat protein
VSRLLAPLLLCTLLASAPALGQPAEEPVLTPAIIAELTLDELFEKLPENAGSQVGRRLEAEILSRLHESGSDTADLLLAWATQAIDEKNYQLALDLLDQIVILEPDFAEAWNKRATVFYLLDDYSASLTDIRQTLALEPRHFGALSGLGFILEALDRKEGAIRAFRRALEINPQLDKIREALERLEKETTGNEI